MKKLESNELMQVAEHHFLTNKHTTRFTNEFQEITDKFWLDIDWKWNKEFLADHSGKHTATYHKFMLQQVEEIKENANWDRQKFLEWFEQLKIHILQNPEILYQK